VRARKRSSLRPAHSSKGPSLPTSLRTSLRARIRELLDEKGCSGDDAIDEIVRLLSWRRGIADETRVDTTWFILSSIAGIFGAAYFIYGKKAQRPVPLFAGVLLCVLPYFIDSIPVLVAVCVALLAAPFVIRIEL
jgi:hypothetical protein